MRESPVLPAAEAGSRSPQSDAVRCRPSFVVALRRSLRLSPYHARFEVPLWFSKLDLRDYLYHLYNVKAIKIRSVVRQHKVEHVLFTPSQLQLRPRRVWHRPPPKKFMVIEMEKPFVWPREPDDFKAYVLRLLRRAIPLYRLLVGQACADSFRALDGTRKPTTTTNRRAKTRINHST